MKIKALFLLFIFLLNSAVGLSCALHKDDDCCDEAAEHHSDHSFLNVHNHQFGTYLAEKDPCCQGTVNNFNTLPKVIPQTCQIILLAPYLYIGSYYQVLLVPVAVDRSSPLVAVEGRRRPPTHPIRIAIQSFQI